MRRSARTKRQYALRGTFEQVRGCEGKKRHANRREAEAAIRSMGDATMTPYKCSFCGKWHKGHNRRARREPSGNDDT
jgi:hypothetical protein